MSHAVLHGQEAEVQRQKAEREQALLQQQRERDAQARQEAAARAEQQRRAEEERARQADAEQRRQQQLRLEQERRAAELKAQLEAEEARRRCAGFACDADKAHPVPPSPWNRVSDSGVTRLSAHRANGRADVEKESNCSAASFLLARPHRTSMSRE